MPGETHTSEESTATAFLLTLVVLVFVGLFVVLLALTATLVLTAAIAKVGISVEHPTRVVDVRSRIPSAIDVRTDTQ